MDGKNVRGGGGRVEGGRMVDVVVRKEWRNVGGGRLIEVKMWKQ